MAYHNQDWDDLGRIIQDTVDRAVNSQNFQKLNQTVRQVVDRAIDAGTGAVRTAADSIPQPDRNQDVRKLYGSVVGKAIKSVLKIAVGFPFSFFSAAMVLWGENAETHEPVINSPPVTALFLFFLVIGLWLTFSGVSTLGMVKRFRAYQRVLGQKTHCALEKLARSVNKSEKYVRMDLRLMIRKNLFREGHLDKEKTCLITSDETYYYYTQSRLEFEQRQRQEAAVKAQQMPAARDAQVQEVLDQGNSFIAQIRKCNDDIPGEEISEKISRIELIVQRIFERAEAHPEIVPDLKKMMDYYLPMTVKLLEAYADMDAQPIRGETIQASKREIEETLDTLNLAFEKLLDSIFADTAMDVSSDISVLNALLAQEGLAEDDFSKARKQSDL